MAAVTAPTPKLDRYIVIHVATTCDEHGVYVTKDSAEVIELGWILLDSKTCEEVHITHTTQLPQPFYSRPAPASCPKAPHSQIHHPLKDNKTTHDIGVSTNFFFFSQFFSCTVKVSSSSQSTLPSRRFAVSFFFCPLIRTDTRRDRPETKNPN